MLDIMRWAPSFSPYPWSPCPQGHNDIGPPAGLNRPPTGSHPLPTSRPRTTAVWRAFFGHHKRALVTPILRADIWTGETVIRSEQHFASRNASPGTATADDPDRGQPRIPPRLFRTAHRHGARGATPLTPLAARRRDSASNASPQQPGGRTRPRHRYRSAKGDLAAPPFAPPKGAITPDRTAFSPLRRRHSSSGRVRRDRVPRPICFARELRWRA